MTQLPHYLKLRQLAAIVFFRIRDYPIAGQDLVFYFCSTSYKLPILSRSVSIPGKPDCTTLLKTKDQVMKKIRLMLEDENVQARLVIAGFVMIFALLVIFFF